ncbi:TAXI family TRAP transporter solute-binding subunit [Shouchella shacheensis]|uniref:TAXI family TRAP transporter solute-binding subunit n=1 Tax=Shouchella shacheensis TaxID=1649580 RepID=UPI00073FD34C|nr:TAXI family TRAP transporter solute-binding subunit [Shouchella shacheensis]
MKKWGLTVGTAGLLALAGCGGEGAGGDANDDLMHSHISGPTASGWYPLSTLMTDIWMDDIEGANITVVEGGAIGNIRDVNNGEMLTGMAFASDFADAVAGRGSFEDDPQENVMGIAVLYPTLWNFAVLDSSPYESIEDALENGADIIPGEASDASAQTAERVFEAMGYTLEDIEANGGSVTYNGYGDANNQMRDGLIDMVVQGGSPYVTGLSELDATNPIRPLSIPEEALEKLEEAGFGYTVDLAIPSGSYANQEEDVLTVTTMAMLVVNADMNEETVYQLTKSFWENVERFQEEQPNRGNYFDPEIGYNELVDPEENIHPGAKRYYEEIGVVEEEG